jgi:hypothetical protein
MKRYTIKELTEFSDYEFIYWVLKDREESVTNFNSPMAKRLESTMNKVWAKKELTKTKEERQQENERLKETKLGYE